jgi:hypothetical protein
MSGKKMRLPKVYKPIIKTKQTSFSETLFPNVYSKKKVVYDDFSKIYLTNITNLKGENTEMTIENTKEKIINEERLEKINILKYLNNTYISKEQNESSNVTSPSNIFARDTMNNRFMYSYNNKSKRETLFNNKSSYYNNKFNSNNNVRINNNDLNIGYDSMNKIKIMVNYIPNL